MRLFEYLKYLLSYVDVVALQCALDVDFHIDALCVLYVDGLRLDVGEGVTVWVW